MHKRTDGDIPLSSASGLKKVLEQRERVPESTLYEKSKWWSGESCSAVLFCQRRGGKAAPRR